MTRMNLFINNSSVDNSNELKLFKLDILQKNLKSHIEDFFNTKDTLKKEKTHCIDLNEIEIEIN